MIFIPFQGISGIEFPSSNELTTRCPTELILSSANTFSGSVHIRRFDENDESPDDDHHDVKEEEVKTIEEVTEVIRKSTLAICGVGKNAKVSGDTIVIKLEGAFPNLTLIDLPGLVRNTLPGEDELMGEQVKKMILDYLNEKRTIILTVSATEK